VSDDDNNDNTLYEVLNTLQSVTSSMNFFSLVTLTMGCNTMWFDDSPMFQRNISVPSSGLKSNTSKKPPKTVQKLRYLSLMPPPLGSYEMPDSL
jgi:hypothetical protein